MVLKTKLALFIAGSSLVFSLAYVWLNHLTISHSGNEQKHILTAKVATRVSMVIANEKKRIGTICFDWAAWDVMYDYAEKPTREFESQSMPAAVIPEYDLNLVIIMNRRKLDDLPRGLRPPAAAPRPLRLPATRRTRLLERTSPSISTARRCSSFVSDSEHGPVILVSAPILHSDARGPINGRVVMGRMVNPDFNDAHRGRHPGEHDAAQARAAAGRTSMHAEQRRSCAATDCC